MTLSAPVLVVVGGSEGIGSAIVEKAVDKGYKVIIGYYQNQKAVTVAHNLSVKGNQVKALQVDSSDPHSVEKFFFEAEQELGKPTAMVYCSAIGGEKIPFLEMTADYIDSVVRTNLIGGFYCVQSAAKRMAYSLGGAGGAIVILSSEAGKFGGNRISPYAASKAGLNTMITGVARELGQEGIRLNGVSPGVIDTHRNSKLSEEDRKLLTQSIPIGRFGSPLEAANAVLWLLSDEASYITGTVLSVAGGR